MVAGADSFAQQARVDFRKDGHKAQIIEIVLSICAPRLCPTFENLFTGVNVWTRVYKIGPGPKRSAQGPK